MTIRSLDNTLKNSLLAYDPFIVVHLVKFEKPQSVAQYGGKIAGLPILQTLSMILHIMMVKQI